MSELPENQADRKFVGLVVLAGVLVIVLCGVCVAAGLAFRQNVMPNSNLTRTALVQLFETPGTIRTTSETSPEITQTPIPLRPTVQPERLLAASATTTMALPTPTFAPPIWLDPPQGVIAYTCSQDGLDQICLINADDSQQKQVTKGDASYSYPSMSPDGNQIILSSNLDGKFNLYTMNLDGSNLEQLPGGTGNLYSPEISPNGNRIVYTVDSGGQQTIWIMKRDGSNARPVSSEPIPGSDPSWAPDSTRILFTSSMDGSPQLYSIQASGANPRQITRGLEGLSGRGDWSPDGRWLVFQARPRGGNQEIYRIGADGKDLRQLTDDGDNLMPSISPDGQWIVFVSTRSGNTDLYVMKNDGTQVTRLTGDPLSKQLPSWGPGTIR